jgi:alpha-N-arabinofuranosidase
MQKIGRRTFVNSLLAGGAILLAPRSSRAADSRIEILVNEPIGTISPDIYGHFIEHLGGVIYDGVWVGENSKIANVNGIRKQLVDYLKKVNPSVLRWPGGCFADSYDWRDGVGPRQNRPRRTDFWINNDTRNTNAPQVYEPNHFGTNEFMKFCRQIGSQPYLASNMRSLPARDFFQWVEYCNAPAGLTTLSKLRESGGDRDPFNVRYWGVGNESWGCGGNMTPEEYADEYRKFVAWVPTYGNKMAFIGSGPNAADWRWTRGFFSRMLERGEGQLGSIYGWALHYYCGTTGKRISTEYTTDEWYELLGKADRMESLIDSHWKIMGEFDSRRRVKLIVDEWGAWHARAVDMPETYLWAYPGALRDALISGLTLDTFNRHADKVVMANVAQLINTIHSLFLAYEDKFVATPNYHVFDMYSAHQGAQSVRAMFSAPEVNYKVADKATTMWGLQGSASLKDKQLTLTVVNPHHADAREAEIALRGATVTAGQSRTLTSTDLHAYNSFSNPNALVPVQSGVNASGTVFSYKFAPASVTCLKLMLA